MPQNNSQTVYDFSVQTIEGKRVSLADYRGKALLIVNVASKCGFTPQYKDLEEIYKTYKGQNFEILAFPCNQFGQQEPGNPEEIKNFCSLTYDVSFPLFAKINVNGENEEPLYGFLKNSLPGILGLKMIKWNFTKFLIDKNGVPFARFAPTDKPMDLIEDIKKVL